MGAIQLMIGLAVGLVKAIPSLIKVIPQINDAIVNGLMEGLGSMVDVGRALVAGIWEGISNSLTWIKNKLTGWVGDVTKFIKKLFGIASPSKVMEKQVGLNLGLGVAEGIEGSLGAVHGAMAKLNSEVTASVNPVINPTANSNPLILQIENFINDRGTSIEQLMQEAEFLRRNTALAGGIK
jgi:phage-related protein